MVRRIGLCMVLMALAFWQPRVCTCAGEPAHTHHEGDHEDAPSTGAPLATNDGPGHDHGPCTCQDDPRDRTQRETNLPVAGVPCEVETAPRSVIPVSNPTLADHRHFMDSQLPLYLMLRALRN